MTIDKLYHKCKKASFLQLRISNDIPVDCTAICLFSTAISALIPRYLYVVTPDQVAFSQEVLERSDISLLIPSAVLNSLSPDDFQCDLIIYDADHLSADALLIEIAGILEEEQEVLRFQLHISALLLEDADISAILSYASIELGNPICVLSPSGHLLLQSNFTEALAARDSIIAELLYSKALSSASYAHYHFAQLQRTLLQSLEPFVESQPDLFNRMCFRLMNRRTYLGHIVVFEAQNTFRPTDQECLRILARAVTLKLCEGGSSLQHLFQDNLLQDLLDGHISTLEELANAYPKETALVSKELRLLVLRLDQTTSHMEDASGNYIQTSQQHLIASFPFIRHSCHYHGALVALVEETNMSQILPSLPHFLKTYGLLGAVSNLMIGVFPLSGYYRQCENLLCLLQEKFTEDENRLALFSDMYCNLLLQPLHQQGYAQEAILPEWLRLFSYDEEHGTNYADTLYAYLTQGSIILTARYLHVHKNTMIYRLEKIRDITQCDLENEVFRHRLYLSYHLLKLLRGDSLQ